MYHLLWNAAEQRRHKRRNLIQSALLLGGMVGLLSACGWIVAGAEGVLWSLLAGTLSLLLSPRLSPRLVLRLYRARPLAPWDVPQLYAMLEDICAAAGLGRVPVLWYVPSGTLNAFAVGHRDDAALAVTDGMLRRLSLRELAGVLAHEVSHIRNNDLFVMGLADTIGRLTRAMSLLGLLLLLLTLPFGQEVPWLLVALLTFAPTLGGLLQLALARTREFDADLDAAGLTGDPLGLASALEKIERREGRFWEDILMPGRRMPDPSLLRTHPPTEERIRRLLSLQVPVRLVPGAGGLVLPADFVQDGPPRWRISGYWY